MGLFSLCAGPWEQETLTGRNYNVRCQVARADITSCGLVVAGIRLEIELRLKTLNSTSFKHMESIIKAIFSCEVRLSAPMEFSV